MTQASRGLWPVPLLVVLASCGREGSPTGPSQPPSFLEGTWTGMVSIDREGVPASSGAVTWTFQVVEGTNQQTFRVTIQSQHTWLPITTTVTSAIEPTNQPPARISTQGDYPSPRGCTGSFLSVGTADTTTINADFTGIDCPSPSGSTFTGRFTLTKTAGSAECLAWTGASRALPPGFRAGRLDCRLHEVVRSRRVAQRIVPMRARRPPVPGLAPPANAARWKIYCSTNAVEPEQPFPDPGAIRGVRHVFLEADRGADRSWPR